MDSPSDALYIALDEQIDSNDEDADVKKQPMKLVDKDSNDPSTEDLDFNIQKHEDFVSSKHSVKHNVKRPESLPSVKEVSLSGEFSWNEYLQLTGTIAAPPDCFFQALTPPINRFQVGMKLEAPDPRGSDDISNSVRCLGTVVSVHSVWICIRLDGEDASNDQWIMCDDHRIRPVGDCQKKGLNMQPPYGFMLNLANFHKFLENQLKTDENGMSPAAPDELFKPIASSSHPKGNKFNAGMKCEAIDPKNFNGRPCPATVVAVDGDFIVISYDGWNQAYDTRERYDSRYIFPVGWASKASLKLQPPKATKGKIKQPVIHPVVLLQAKTIELRRKSTVKRRSALSSDVVRRPRKARPSSKIVARSEMQPSSAVIGAVVSTVAGFSDSPRPTDKSCTSHIVPKIEDGVENATEYAIPEFRCDEIKTEVQLENVVCQKVNDAPGLVQIAATHPLVALPIPAEVVGTDTNSTLIGRTIAPKMVGTTAATPVVGNTAATTVTSTGFLKHRARKSLSSVDGTSSHSVPKKPRSHVKPKDSFSLAPDILLSSSESKAQPSSRIMTVYVNSNCYGSSLLDANKIKSLPRLYGPGSFHHILREVIQQIINCAFHPPTVFKKLEPGTPRIISVTAEANGVTHVRAIPVTKNVDEAWSYLRDFVSKLGTCRNLLAKTNTFCLTCSSPNDEVVSTTGGPHVVANLAETSLSTWSIERVAAELDPVFDCSVVRKFVQNQIDGKALILLNTELLIRHLNMAFGPALKLMYFIDQLKRKHHHVLHQ